MGKRAKRKRGLSFPFCSLRPFCSRRPYYLRAWNRLGSSLRRVRALRSNWNFEVLVFEERGKPEYPEKNLSELGREPTTNSTHTGTGSRTRATLVGGERSHHCAITAPQNKTDNFTLRVISSMCRKMCLSKGNNKFW